MHTPGLPFTNAELKKKHTQQKHPNPLPPTQTVFYNLYLFFKYAVKN